MGQLALWTDDDPAGEPLRWSVNLPDEAPPAASTVPGALHRMRSLGYWGGETAGALTPEAEEALRTFQVDHGLEATGKLDAATVAKLEEVQGN